MKKLILSFLLLSSILKAGLVPYTLENLKNLNLYYIDKTGLFTKEQQSEIKNSINKKLIAHGFKIHGSDPSTLVIKVETIDIDDTYIANIVLLVGEEVITKRKDSIQTVSLTYHEGKFFELDEPVQDIKDTIESLLKDFLDLYEEDME